MNKYLIGSFSFHLVVGLLFIVLGYFSVSKNEPPATYTVIEKFKVVEQKINPTTAIKVEKPNPKKKIKSRQVFGQSKKAVTSENSVVKLKAGNTLAKKNDNLKLKKSDAESLPIPAEEYLITSMPKLLEGITPLYPPLAKKKGIEGKVIFDILIDNKGAVRNINLIQSLEPSLDKAARDALSRFRFRPAMINDQEVAIKIKYAINFVLD